ncbi:hypothetical protein M0804_007900 [Polistes exclamans]|nr:hypothetical protein M0804_007900 [Polistes exclamans]
MKLIILVSFLLIVIDWNDDTWKKFGQAFELSKEEGRDIDWTAGEPFVVLENDETKIQESLSLFYRFKRPNRIYSENPKTHHPIRHARKYYRSVNSSVVPEIKWPIKKEAVVEGDLLLGGLMMVHERKDSEMCGPIMPQGGIQALEAMLYTLDQLNSGEGIVPGVKIGAHILDDCDRDTYGLEMAVDFIKGSISNIDGAEYHCNKTTVRKVISGVVGAASSVTSIQVANLLRLFRIPQVSFFSTSPELSNKQRFEYFSRTIPSDHYQVKAMVDIVLKMGWSYVSIIYEESNYGIKVSIECNIPNGFAVNTASDIEACYKTDRQAQDDPDISLESLGCRDSLGPHTLCKQQNSEEILHTLLYTSNKRDEGLKSLNPNTQEELKSSEMKDNTY